MVISNAWKLFLSVNDGGAQISHQEFVFGVSDGLLLCSVQMNFTMRPLLANRSQDHMIVPCSGKTGCVVCWRSGKRRRRSFMCSACEVVLCPGQCFTEYHDRPFKVSGRVKNPIPR